MTETPRNDADDFLLGGGAKSASFLTPGTTHQGVIVEDPVKVQARDFATGELKTWSNGDPVWQLRVTLQTQEKEDADDDGRRAIYLKGSRDPKSASLLAAVVQAVQAAGAPGLRVGGTLAVQYVDDGVAEKGNPPKRYRAAYTPPAPEADAWMTPQAPQAPASQPPAPPAAQAQPWPPAPATQVAGQQAFPVVDTTVVNGRTHAQALELAGQLKRIPIPDAAIKATCPELSLEEIAAIGTYTEPPF